MTYGFSVPESKKVRLIINTDAKNEADDQFAVVHALLSPKFIQKGIIAAHYGKTRTEQSMESSFAECEKLLDIMGLSKEIKVYRGAMQAVAGKESYEFSEGAKRIVEEALSEDISPLFVIFLGPLTDLACAYLRHPEIAGRLTAVWIGGGQYPNGSPEFNLVNDIFAANVIMKSEIALWQVPKPAYSMMRVSLAELEYKVKPCGAIGKYLFSQLEEFNASPLATWTTGESWCLGDSPAVGLLLHEHAFEYHIAEAPGITNEMQYIHNTGYRAIRIYDRVDARFILEDMYCKLAQSYPPKN